MTYDIPPPLQYKERVLFGLTFSQLAYALPSGLLVFLILKVHGSLLGKLLFVTMIVVSAGFFMFFDGYQWCKSMWYYLSFRKSGMMGVQMKRLIGLKGIKDSIIHTSTGNVAILEVTPINFMIRTEEEQESITKGFQKFLNSLDFPVQFHISSDTISLRQHLKVTKRNLKPELNEVFDSYCKFIKGKNDNILNRRFYLIIPEKDDLETQVRLGMEGLQQLRLSVRRLKENQILRMCYTYFNGQGTRKLPNCINNTFHALIAPERIENHMSHMKVNDQYCEIISVTGYPSTVEHGFLDKIISCGENYDISIHIEPFSLDSTMVNLNRELQKQRADLYAEEQKGILNPSLQIKFQGTMKVLEDLQKGRQKLFNVSLYIMCKGTKDEAELLRKRVEAQLKSSMIQPSTPHFRMRDAYESMLPLGRDTLKEKRNISTSGLGAFFPFTSPFLNIEPEGILLGLNKNKIPYVKDIFKLTNANGLVLATSGSGKSYFTKLLLSRQLMSGCDVMIIDPQGEYSGITQHYKGQVITISKDSETIINPLDLMGHEYLEKRLSLMDLFKIMLGDLTEIQQAILDKAIDLTYARKGINRDSYKGKQPPKMQDLYDELVGLETTALQQEKVTYRALLNRLGMYTENGVFSFLNKDTNIDFDNSFVCFSLGAMPKQVKPVVMFLVLDYIYMKMKDNLRRKLLVVDEAWSMLQTAEESSYLFEIVKTCRKYNLGLLMITQDVADLVGSKAGHAVLANTAYTFLLRQKPAVMQQVSKTFNLSQAEKEYLVTATRGNGILILENEHQELEVIASEVEHKLITTNADEINKKEEPAKPKGEEIKINIDLTKNVHYAENMSLEERNFLANRGYELRKGYGLKTGKDKPRTYMIKRMKPESLTHTFITELILAEIQKHTDKVARYCTKKPDVVFTNKHGREVAIEVETGEGFSKHKKRLVEKFERVNKEYPEHAYIVLTDSTIRDRYQRFNIPIILRKDIQDIISIHL